MKAFSRFTAITLSVAMIIASVFTVGVFADTVTFTDVGDDNQYNQAIYSLVSKGIINGYTEADGTSTFKPDNTITRAEFAKLLVLATTSGVTHTATTDKFPDLALDHWANTYIAAAVNTGAINGYDDGTFKPENPVSYGEAVKMIVCTLGYASIVTPTEPWYDGYIKVANSISLTKGAAGLGTNEAKRGLVAQLIYNISGTKQLVQTGTDSSGNAVYRSSSDDDDLEEITGIVTGVFETTLEGVSYDLNKEQIMIDDGVFYVGEYSVDDFLPYLGKSITVEYEDGSKDIIKDFEEYKNSTLTVKDFDIDVIDGRKITYYADNKEDDLTLASDLYVVYNGRGVERKLIDDDFIETYLNVDSGEITFLNNDSKSDYDVAFVTSYQTMFVTSKSGGTDGVYTIYDTYGPVNEITLKNGDCTVYKVASKGGTKTKVDSSTPLSSITANTVISIAAPLDQTDGTEVIISSVNLSGKQVESVSKYDYTIGGTEYEMSAYYEALVEADPSKYELEKGDAGTFYLDFLGRIAFYKKSETTDPYGYLATSSGSSGLNSNYTVSIFTQSGSMSEFTLADNVKVNGTRCTPSEAISKLEYSAAAINSGKPDEIVENADIAQLIKYKTNSSGQISEIFTINPDDLESGNIIPGKFTAEGGTAEKAYFSTGEKLTCVSSGSTGRLFKDAAGGSQFTVNSSTIAFYVPYDRTADKDDYKKRAGTAISTDTKYIVEPYDMSSTTAKVVVIYVGNGTTDATIEVATKPVFIEQISQTTNDGKSVEKISYYTAGSTTLSTIYTNEKTSLKSLGINPGDVVKFAVENNEVCGVQKVFVGGELYDWNAGSVFDTFVDDDNIVTKSYSSDADYYQVVYGKVYSKTDENDQITVTPIGGSDWLPYGIAKSSTKFYKWDSDKDVFDTSIESIDGFTTIDKVSEDAATKIVAIKMNTSLLAVYIIEE